MSDLLVYCTKNWFEQYECLETVDLSPVHVASWVLTVDDYRLASILLQLRELKRESNRGIVLHCEKFMCSWTPTEFVEFIDHVKQRLEDAEEVIRFGAAKDPLVPDCEEGSGRFPMTDAKPRPAAPCAPGGSGRPGD